MPSFSAYFLLNSRFDWLTRVPSKILEKRGIRTLVLASLLSGGLAQDSSCPQPSFARGRGNCTFGGPVRRQVLVRLFAAKVEST
jgi:hypothetical protein